MTLMSTKLYNYVNMSLKYIFLFENGHESMNEDFLISEHPEDLQMPGLWHTPEVLETLLSLPDEIENANEVYQKWEENQINYDRTHYHSHIVGIKRIVYQTHRDVIENNVNTRFKVIKVPISFSLRHKTIQLSPWYKTNFTTDEICILLKYFVLFSENVMIQLAKILCEYLINEKTLIQEIQMYRNCFSGSQPMSSTINPLTSVFGTEETIAQFNRLVKSCIIFNITDENKSMFKFYGQSLQTEQSSVLNVDQNCFALAFFFGKLEMDSEWLIKNKNTLDTVFTDSMVPSLYSVTIKNPKNVCEDTNMVIILEELLNTIATSKFLTGKNVSELTLELNGIHTEVNMSCLKSVNSPITVSCTHFSLEFLTSIPSFIKIRANIDECFSIESFNAFPKNVVHISYKKENLHANMTIPDHVESVHIELGGWGLDETLTLSQNCKSLILDDSTGKVIFPSVAECKMESRIGTDGSKFEFKINETEKQKIMHVNAATIYTTVNIDERIEKVIFSNVNVVKGSTIVFNNNCKQLKIVQSKGSFDIRPYIGIKHYFDYWTELKILPGKKSFPNMSSIKLSSFHFMQTVKLPNIYESIELEYVSTTEDTEIILNTACKKLRIDDFRGVINVHEIEYLESLHIDFSMKEEGNIRFFGSIRVNQIYISNICWGNTSIISILTNFKNIRYIEFEDESFLMFIHYQKCLYDSLIRCITSKKGNGDESDLLSKLLAITDRDSNTLMYEALNIIINFVLRNIIGKGVMDKISELELGHFVIDQDNCKSLKKLKNLKILRIRTEKITNEFFYNLPPSLILLDITNFAKEAIFNTEKYVIKPSIIVQQHQNIKILSVNVDFLYNVRYLSLMMPSLDILAVQYSRSVTDCPRMQKSKIKVRDLLITYDSENLLSLTNEAVVLFINQLKFYIDFELLECIEFVTSPRSVFFNPKTLRVIR